jgi:hypothetical protein
MRSEAFRICESPDLLETEIDTDTNSNAVVVEARYKHLWRTLITSAESHGGKGPG